MFPDPGPIYSRSLLCLQCLVGSGGNIPLPCRAWGFASQRLIIYTKYKYEPWCFIIVTKYNKMNGGCTAVHLFLLCMSVCTPFRWTWGTTSILMLMRKCYLLAYESYVGNGYSSLQRSYKFVLFSYIVQCSRNRQDSHITQLSHSWNVSEHKILISSFVTLAMYFFSALQWNFWKVMIIILSTFLN